MIKASAKAISPLIATVVVFSITLTAAVMVISSLTSVTKSQTSAVESRVNCAGALLNILQTKCETINWWNSSWQYRQKINITNNAGSVLEQNYTVNITFNHSELVSQGKSLANGNDVRIVWYDFSNKEHVELDRINTTPFNTITTNTTLLFKLQQSISANSWDANYSLYYGNPSAGAAPANGSNVYVTNFSDNFNDNSIDTTVWTSGQPYGNSGCSWSETNGMLEAFNNFQGYCSVKLEKNISTYVEISASLNLAAGDSSLTKYMCFGLFNNISSVIKDLYLCYRLGTTRYVIIKFFNGTSKATPQNEPGDTLYISETNPSWLPGYHKLTLFGENASYKSSSDGVTWTERWSGYANYSNYSNAYLQAENAQGIYVKLVYDDFNIISRKYLSPEPSAAKKAEESNLYPFQAVVYNPSSVELTNLSIVAEVNGKAYTNTTAASVPAGGLQILNIELPSGEVSRVRVSATNCPVWIERRKEAGKIGTCS